MSKFDEVAVNFLTREDSFCEYASLSKDGIRLKEFVDDFRSSYYRDTDRIIHSLSYTRYMDKTQVYSYKSNDHISKRMVHVQFVSKIARTICRALRLNEDLAEAIGLGHDIGHTPLGHTGEMLLDEICVRELNERFLHNIQSVRHYMEIENSGNGINLCVQVLDGIMCHNGEMLSSKYEVMKKDVDEFLKQYKVGYTDKKLSNSYRPMTLEGCVVRISDIIAYIGRDIEDAIELGLFNREDIPSEISKVLGNSNNEIVNNIIKDIIENSYNKDYVKLSDEVYTALNLLKKFNYDTLYKVSLSVDEIEYYRVGMNKLFNKYVSDINNNVDSDIYKLFLNNKSDSYVNNNCSKRIVVDFIAGMTDKMFLAEINKID